VQKEALAAFSELGDKVTRDRNAHRHLGTAAISDHLLDVHEAGTGRRGEELLLATRRGRTHMRFSCHALEDLRTVLTTGLYAHHVEQRWGAEGIIALSHHSSFNPPLSDNKPPFLGARTL
jgi:hypothetical protein